MFFAELGFKVYVSLLAVLIGYWADQWDVVWLFLLSAVMGICLAFLPFDAPAWVRVPLVAAFAVGWIGGVYRFVVAGT